MPGDQLDLDIKAPPFDRFRNIRRLGSDRSGHWSGRHRRHQLYIGREKRDRIDALIKLMSKPGLVYERNLANEIDNLTTINRELPESRYFPLVLDHGRLRDGRLYLITTLFDEFPLGSTIGPDPIPARLVGHLRTAIAISRALSQLHGIGIFHVDLNPMNVLYRSEKGAPVIRIVDFESSYNSARHGDGEFYDPPTTPGYSAPELGRQRPDARSDLYSLGAVLYTMLASYGWTWSSDVTTAVEADASLDAELKEVLSKTVGATPEDRYQSAEEFRAALSRYLERIWPGREW